MQQAGGAIDFLNVQYYNTAHIGTAAFAAEQFSALHGEGDVDTAKLLFGKPSCRNVTVPAFTANCANSGYMSPVDAAGVVSAIRQAGVPFGGAMTWQMANEWAYFNGSFGLGSALKAAF